MDIQKKRRNSKKRKSKFKTRLVVKGFTQKVKKKKDYNKKISPVMKHRSIRMLLALVAYNDLELE